MNYHECCIAEVLDVNQVGVGTGEAVSASSKMVAPRVCVSLPHWSRCNPRQDGLLDLLHRARSNWISLSPEVAGHLLDELLFLRKLGRIPPGAE